MSARLVEIRDRAVTLIESYTPHHDPNIAFREAPYHLPLDEMEPAATAMETTRQFHCLCLADVDSGQFLTTVVLDLVASLLVRIRYDVRRWDDGVKRIHNYTGQDAVDIKIALEKSPLATAWPDQNLCNIRLVSSSGILPTATDGVMMLELRFEVTFSQDAITGRAHSSGYSLGFS